MPIEPFDPDTALSEALRCHRAGRLGEAENHYRRILQVDPDHVDALHLLGVIAQQIGQNDRAIALIVRAIVLDPSRSFFHSNLGISRTKLGHLEEAVTSAGIAIRLQPDQAEAHSNRGLALAGLGRFDQAALAHKTALCLRPDFAEACSNRGIALQDLGQLIDAVTAHHRALCLKPDFAEACSNLGKALKALRRRADALLAYRTALCLKPNYAEAWSNLGSTLKALARIEAAVTACRRAIWIKPDYVEAYCNLGAAQIDRAELDDAVTAFSRARELKPDHANAHNNLLMALHYQASVSGGEILAQARRFAAQFEQDLPPSGFANRRDPDRRLRVGYVSPDFRRHSVAWYFEPLLDAHDRAEVELFCYAEVEWPDQVTERIRSNADHWRMTIGRSDAELAELIKRDQIDILVDLAGHTSGNRLTMFALKPAPIQLSWLGYPGTTGLSRIDYRLVDAITDPEQHGDQDCSEGLLRLADGFLCYAPPSDAPPVTRSPSAGAPITFGSFNNPAKLSEATLDAWAALLAQLPTSRLILKGGPFDDPPTQALFLDHFRCRGIDPARLTLLGHLAATADHLALYQQIDIALDPFPYNGTTTSCEALWMGVPVITLRGDRHSARVGASILHRLGLDELVAETTEDYIKIAAHLAADEDRRRELSASLRQRMAASPLCNSQRFARAIEQSYRAIWRQRVNHD